jgi:hypothetical protein
MTIIILTDPRPTLITIILNSRPDEIERRKSEPVEIGTEVTGLLFYEQMYPRPAWFKKESNSHNLVQALLFTFYF